MLGRRSPPLKPSPVTLAFPHIQWDPLSSLRLTAQETALLRMAETNPIEYTLADSRDASMYARVLLKLLSESSSAGGNAGRVSTLTDSCDEDVALTVLEIDPLGVVMHYAITKLHSIVTTLMLVSSGVTVANVFYVGKDSKLVDQWRALLRIIDKGGRGDSFAQSGAALCLALILVSSCPSIQTSSDSDANSSNQKGVDEQFGERKSTGGKAPRSQLQQKSYASAVEPLEALIVWIVSQLKSSASHSTVALAIPAMNAIMSTTETRHLFAKSNGIRYLVRQLKTLVDGKKGAIVDEKKNSGSSTAQQLYELTFSLLCMSYELDSSHAIRSDFSKDGTAIVALTSLVAAAPREKCVRVSLSTLVNLSRCNADENAGPADSKVLDGSSFLTDMLACRLLKQINHLEDRQFTDPDLADDLAFLHRSLAENYKEMTRWDVYKTEVESGHLQWGSTHTEAFFKENARMMEGKDSDFKIVKVLIALLASHDDEIASIACYDIGEFVRFYPNGRSIAINLGAKAVVMPLIEHENIDLQRAALQCISKIMVQNWEYVND